MPAQMSPALGRLFSELIDGASTRAGAFVLNTGDAGFLRSLDKLSAADASRSVNGGATIAAHVQHLRDGLSLMNRWASVAGNPKRFTRRSTPLATGAQFAACRHRHRAHRGDGEHRAPRLPSWRDSADRQAIAWTYGGHVPSFKSVVVNTSRLHWSHPQVSDASVGRVRFWSGSTPFPTLESLIGAPSRSPAAIGLHFRARFRSDSRSQRCGSSRNDDSVAANSWGMVSIALCSCPSKMRNV